MTLTSTQKKTLRQIAHHLEVVVSLGAQGLSDALRKETDRALTDHELIKVKLEVNDRVERRETGERLAGDCGAEIVQRIGKVVVLYRENPKADPRLSNVRRYS